ATHTQHGEETPTETALARQTHLNCSKSSLNLSNPARRVSLTFGLLIQPAATGCDVSEFLAPPSSPAIPSPAADPSVSGVAPESPRPPGTSPAIPGMPAALPLACCSLPGEFSRRPATPSTPSAPASALAFQAPPGADPRPAPPMCSPLAP